VRIQSKVFDWPVSFPNENSFIETGYLVGFVVTAGRRVRFRGDNGPFSSLEEFGDQGKK
jgi:hypothetical protein